VTPITPGQKIFFAVICAAALLVAILGLFNPAYLASIFTWLDLPPLHARFVGAIYAFGAVFMAGCLFARRQAEVRWAVQLIGIWTGMLFICALPSTVQSSLRLMHRLPAAGETPSGSAPAIGPSRSSSSRICSAL